MGKSHTHTSILLMQSIEMIHEAKINNMISQE